MRRILLIFVILLGLSSSAFAALQYLAGPYSVAETTFESPSTAWSAGDDQSIQVSLGFNFSFNGTTYNQVWINSNGMLSFNSSNTKYDNIALPYADEPQSIYPYWDDLNRPSGGTIKYQTFGSGTNHHFVVGWDSVRHFSSYGSYTFQVVLYENGDIRFRYDSASNADGTNCVANAGCYEYGNSAGATIGVQEDTSHYNQFSYDTAINQSKDVLYRAIDNDYSDWHFDELSWNGTAGEVVDSHDTNHGTAHNVSPIVGKICNAIDFRANGTTDYAVLGANALDEAGDFTVSVWHKGVPGTDSNSLLSGANVPRYNEFIFWFPGSTTFRGYLRNYSIGSIAISNINDNSWQHFVWRRAGDDLCFFVNGSLAGCQSSKEERILDIASLILGQEQDNLGGGFDGNQDWEGILDELIIFRRALSDAEISDGYDNQNSGKNWDGSMRVCPAMPIMSVTKTSCVLSDPVNASSNPKRIPSATIRYAVEVSNVGSGTADSVIVDDNLSVHFDYGTIRNLQVKAGACDCAGVTSASANPAPGTGNGVNPIKLNFDTVAGGSIGSPTKECGYFEVDLK